MGDRSSAAYSDSELLDKLEHLLLARDYMFELWFDSDSGILWAGAEMGDTLRGALTKLLNAEEEEDA